MSIAGRRKIENRNKLIIIVGASKFINKILKKEMCVLNYNCYGPCKHNIQAPASPQIHHNF